MGKYKRLSIEERSLIQTQLTLGFKPSWIAEDLGRSVSTVTRELRRNGWERPVVERDRGRPPIAGKYRAVLAQARAVKSSAKPRVGRRLQVGSALWAIVMIYLRQGYSPEQVSGTLKSVNQDQPSLQAPHEAIYSAIYLMPRTQRA